MSAFVRPPWLQLMLIIITNITAATTASTTVVTMTPTTTSTTMSQGKLGGVWTERGVGGDGSATDGDAILDGDQCNRSRG